MTADFQPAYSRFYPRNEVFLRVSDSIIINHLFLPYPASPLS